MATRPDKRGIIGPGDVQWMTAGVGVLHQEFHSPEFTRTGGLFQVVQLWVNLPAALKLTPPRYQAIEAAQMPVVALAGGAGRVRVIAGSFAGHVGPASTFTPVNVWDLILMSETRVAIDAPEGHTTVIVILSGRLAFQGGAEIRDAEAALLSRAGEGAALAAAAPTRVLVLTGAHRGADRRSGTVRDEFRIPGPSSLHGLWRRTLWRGQLRPTPGELRRETAPDAP
jgi:redox-sensitive bicupin YhaK (pirin superfamily)